MLVRRLWSPQQPKEYRLTSTPTSHHGLHGGSAPGRGGAGAASPSSCPGNCATRSRSVFVSGRRGPPTYASKGGIACPSTGKAELCARYRRAAATVPRLGSSSLQQYISHPQYGGSEKWRPSAAVGEDGGEQDQQQSLCGAFHKSTSEENTRRHTAGGLPADVLYHPGACMSLTVGAQPFQAGIRSPC